MNGCSWEILHFITIYFISVKLRVAQHCQQCERNKHTTNHNIFSVLYTHIKSL